jgi:hypothetical protein
MCIGSPLLVREPTSFQTKEETRWLPTTNQLTRCDAATSKLRSGRMSVRKVRSSQRRSRGRLKISLAHGRNGTSFGLNDLEALMTVAHEAKQWIAAHVLKR